MTRVWHYLNAGDSTQTAEEDLFVKHCQSGVISDATMIWTSGMEAWKSFAEVRNEQAAIHERAAAAKDSVKAADAKPVADEPNRHQCVACKKDWPEPLMVKPKRDWYCRPCFVKVTLAAQKKAKASDGKGEPLYKNKWLIGGVAAALVGAYLVTHFVLVAREDAGPKAQPSEKWASSPSDDWPQLCAASDVLLRGRPPLSGVPNVCLVQVSPQVILAVGSLSTFQAMFASDGSHAPAGAGSPPARITPDQTRAQLSASLSEWRLNKPGGAPTAFRKVRNRPADYAASQVLLLEPAAPLPETASLPATPLTIRTDPIEKNLLVHIVASPPVGAGTKQSVVAGKIHAAFNGKRNLDLEMPEPVSLKALLGAPVIDEGGHLVGVVDGSFDTPDRNGLIQSLSAESVIAFAVPLGVARPTPTPGQAPAATKQGASAAASSPGLSARMSKR